MTTLKRTSSPLDCLAGWGADLPLRLFLAWEFFESGLEKFNGSNWFGDIQGRFPLPFSLLPAELNWHLSMWAELVLPLLLLLGLGTRLAAAGLALVTVVAIVALHWPAHWSDLAELAKGYAMTDLGFGAYKLPLIYLAALLPLLLNGAGRLSVDHWIKRHIAAQATTT
ncbi:HvfX family Cu-binding RiPP maturation protein [Pseudomonas putida]|uniref:HvfX family Cu-binding RiPP maturation protein n=1 Tax=Pseudomonas putida TaxID=303 RepID=UPI001F518AA1|nr:DoxX family protein [Pseudomonas putida]MCI0911293.1 DoxX family protein [Pseudomonas putida]